jgi:tetratricopeptide (TPR) repeat protein
VVEGAVGVRAPNLLVDYSLQLCADGAFKTLIHEVQPFTADRALEQISIISNFINFKLADLAPTVKVTIAISQPQDEKEVADALKLKLTQTIADMSGLEVTDSGEYVIQGRLVVQKPTRAIIPLPKLSKPNNLKVEELRIVAHGKPYPLKSVAGTRDKLPEFYLQVGTAVRNSLPQVLLAERLGWPKLLDNMTVDDLLEKGRLFLCVDQTAGCKKDVPSAIPVLIKATGISPNDLEAFSLLGRAQLLSGQYSDAVKSLELARAIEETEKKQGKSVTIEKEVNDLNLLGDAYNGIEKYDRAIESYNKSLILDPPQAKIYDKKALATAYGGDRPAALKILVEGLGQTGNSATASAGLRQSAKNLIQRLESSELPAAENILKGAYETNASSVRNEYALLLDREGNEGIDAAKNQEEMKRSRIYLQRALEVKPPDNAVRASVLGDLARSYLGYDMDKANSFLTAAETIPSEHLTSNLRAWILQLRAWYWLDRKNYEKAYELAQNAHDAEHSRGSDSVLARAALALGKSKLADATTAAAGDKKQLLLDAEKLFQQTINLVDSFINDRIGDEDSDYAEASHGLGRDSDALARFQKIAEQNPRDASALRNILYICNEYLFQPDCAYKAATLDVEAEGLNADAYLNAIEVAALYGKDDQAGKWLDAVFNQTEMTAPQESIGYFYRLWLASRQNQKDAETSSFRAWQAAIEEFRKSGEEPTWTFEGAKHTLEHSQFDEDSKKLFFSMIAAMEDRTKPLPVFSPR